MYICVYIYIYICIRFRLTVVSRTGTYEMYIGCEFKHPFVFPSCTCWANAELERWVIISLRWLASGFLLLCVSGDGFPFWIHFDIRVLVSMSCVKCWNYIDIDIYIYKFNIYIYYFVIVSISIYDYKN